ncbi:MAG TPA: protein kinase, partial [Nannocystaceae bacterium]|nr:protein kinase [Nannocystaceae bacterium]
MGSERSTATKAESTSPTWEHPRAELREELQRRPAAWVASLRGASRDPLLVARIPAVYRKLTAAGVPHVLPLLAVERDGDRLLLVHRHESGESLAHRLARGRLPVVRTLTILRAICRSLAAAHRAGVEHRALGPSSVLLGAHDELWLIDFAVADLFDALAEDPEVDAPDVALHPMTPERARGEDGSEAEDVYLVGCLAYWMIAGVPPFAAVDLDELAQRHATLSPRPLTELAAEPVPFTLVDVVARALAKQPDERFADLDELDRALAQ